MIAETRSPKLSDTGTSHRDLRPIRLNVRKVQFYSNIDMAAA